MVRFLLFSFLSLAWGCAAFAAPQIDWRVKQPFRFFTESRDFDMHREALADVLAANGGDVPADIVSKLERTINDPRWLKEWYRGNTGLYTDPEKSGRPERGWAHHINRRSATCWDWRKQWHSDCSSDTFGVTTRTDYVRPQRHTVEFRLIDPPGGICVWSATPNIFIGNETKLAASIQRSCALPVDARVPFEPEKPEAQRGIDVTVRLPDGSDLRAAKVWVRDRLIVGIGDSYSSGEGNPDTPVEISRKSHRWQVNRPLDYDATEKAMRRVAGGGFHPVRGENGPAGWLDRKCHRSAYSYHLRTALQVALADPKRSAVTFLGFACSGSRIFEGLLQTYEGVENIDPALLTADGRRRQNLSQVDRLMIELCRADPTALPKRKLEFSPPLRGNNGAQIRDISLLRCPDGQFLRPIDMLIISIAGNDVGFSSLIVDVLASKKPPIVQTLPIPIPSLDEVVRVLVRNFGGISVAEAERRTAELPRRFDALKTALAPMPIARAGGKPNIVLTAFPKVEFNENGKLCGLEDKRETLEGIHVRGMLVINEAVLRKVSDFVNGPLNNALIQAARDNNWRFVDKHREVFRTHGVCAQNRPASGVSATENMMMPYYKDAPVPQWFGFEPFSDYRPNGANRLRDTRPYAPRQRWFRTLVDAYLFVQFWPKGSPPGMGEWGLTDPLVAALGGPFHPTAEGHSRIADAVYAEASKFLALPAPTVATLRGN